MELGLRRKRAFVTGGSAGIGLAVAQRLRSEGAVVSICGRDAARLAGAVASLGGGGSPGGGAEVAWGVQADVTDPHALGGAVDGAAEQMGGLDLLVANAGGSAGRDLLDSTPDDWAQTYALNVLHAAHAIRVAVPHLGRSSAPSVVIVSSITGWKPGPLSSYASAKAAEIHLATVLAQELAPQGIRVNAVSPGSTLFPGGGWARFGDAHPNQLAAFAHDEFPAGRLVALDEVADAVCFVLSERASGINGANVPVDGGQGRPSARVFPRRA